MSKVIRAPAPSEEDLATASLPTVTADPINIAPLGEDEVNDV